MRGILLTLSLALLPSSALAVQETGSAGSGGADDGRALVDENCLYCHDDSYIRALNLGREQWEEVLDLMIGMGMPPLDPEVQEQILDYLEEEHGPRDRSAPAQAAPASGGSETQDLPWALPRYRPNPLYWRER